ncbi:MAG: hypothetical protein QUS11_09345 [Candidatus Fermentibacter sp.]|nr:hypothetical protein [Candidatus Fermentibacter sp.]
MSIIQASTDLAHAVQGPAEVSPDDRASIAAWVRELGAKLRRDGWVNLADVHEQLAARIERGEDLERAEGVIGHG